MTDSVQRLGREHPLGWTKILAPGTPPEVRATQRASFNHPVFTQPADRSERVWRYMDFPKFIHLIAYGTLYFARVDKLGDDWEGKVPVGSVASFREYEKKARLGGPEAAAKDWRAAWIEAHERESWCMFASCWHKQQYESDHLWTKYGSKPYGVAIRSTYERLDAALPLAFESMEVLLGSVSYGDYHSTEYVREVDNSFNFWMSKRIEHQADNEVRAIFNAFRVEREQAQIGYNVTVLLPTLVEAVITAPGAPEWFTNLVRHMCVSFHIDAPVGRSSLDCPPVIPF